MPYSAEEMFDLVADVETYPDFLPHCIGLRVTSRRIAAMGPEIEALCDRLIDGFPEGPFDLLDAYGRIIPVIVIARLLGVPEERADDLLRPRQFKRAPVTLLVFPPPDGNAGPLRIVFGREPVQQPFVLTLALADTSVAIRADGIGHFTVD